MKNKDKSATPGSTPQLNVNEFLGVLQRNELDGTVIPIETILPFNVDPELVLQLQKALDDYQVIAEA